MAIDPYHPSRVRHAERVAGYTAGYAAAKREMFFDTQPNELPDLLDGPSMSGAELLSKLRER